MNVNILKFVFHTGTKRKNQLSNKHQIGNIQKITPLKMNTINIVQFLKINTMLKLS